MDSDSQGPDYEGTDDAVYTGVNVLGLLNSLGVRGSVDGWDINNSPKYGVNYRAVFGNAAQSSLVYEALDQAGISAHHGRKNDQYMIFIQDGDQALTVTPESIQVAKTKLDMFYYQPSVSTPQMNRGAKPVPPSGPK